jgi:hypothetical protein
MASIEPAARRVTSLGGDKDIDLIGTGSASCGRMGVDHIPAKRFGLATCWIHRRAGQAGHGATRPPEVEVSPDFHFATLGEMADAHRAEIRG